MEQTGHGLDPVAVAQELQQTILDRISAEAALRSSVDSTTLAGLRQQLTVAESMRSAVASMQSTVDGLRLGGSSLMNPYDQLNYASGKFEDAVARALAGDGEAWKDVQSYGQSYYQLGADNYASSPPAVAIADRVTSVMDQLIAMGADADPTVTALNTQIELIEQGNEKSSLQAQEEITQFERLYATMGDVEQREQAARAAQELLLQKQLDAQQKTIDALRAQMEQAAEVYRKTANKQDAQIDQLRSISDSIRLLEAKL